MAKQEAPISIDVTDIQFKVHSKYQLFNVNAATPNFNGIDLLATASNFGLVIVGRPASTEIEVLQLKDVVANKESQSVPVRTIKVPGEPYVIAVSCDHTMLSVCYMVNGLSFIDIYAVQSFLSANIKCFQSKIKVSNAEGVKVKQILWNPVIANTMAICLSDGTLAAYVFKETGSFEYNSLDKSENACCACWSPKGKQIVVAFPIGKLAQYKPDLKLAKTIPCTVPLFPVQFLPIAIQWLSTFQFAVVFIEQKEDAAQALYIVNAPKNVPPTYINYDDITYSQSGPRAPQIFLIHILQWNILLMGSSNSTEIGILGTTETGETPLWQQYIFIDEGRAELPLTPDKKDTFPIGVALETGCTHQLIIGENQIPVMPMLHILSTHGFVLSFNFLNFQPARVDICSPPQNIADQSGMHLFRPMTVDNNSSPATPPTIQSNIPPQPMLSNVLKLGGDPQANITFDISGTGATSTPTKPPAMQIKPTFGLAPNDGQPPKPVATSLFGSSALGSTGFSLGGGAKEIQKPLLSQPPVWGAAPSTPAPAQAPSPQAVASVIPQKPATDANKPFITVSSNYKPATQSNKNFTLGSAPNTENDEILWKIIKDEIETFDAEIRDTLKRSKDVQINICSKEDVSKLIKNIDEMQEISSQATESTNSIKSDVQSLRLTLLEMHAMLAEAQSKVDEFKKVGKSSDGSLGVNQTYRRLVNKLQKQLTQNQAHFDVLSKQLDANWSAHLQNQRENNKARMRIPSLENVYQTLEKQQQILLRGREKINRLKAHVGGRDASPNKIKYSYSNTDNLKMNSLADSVLSLTLGDQIKHERKLLNIAKLGALRQLTLKGRQVNLVKPSRPEQRGINSEIIIEKKIADVKAKIEKDKLKKVELEMAEKKAKAKQEELEKAKQVELEKQIALTKPKPLLPTPQIGGNSLSYTSNKPLFGATAEVKPLYGEKPTYGLAAAGKPEPPSFNIAPTTTATAAAPVSVPVFETKPLSSTGGFAFSSISKEKAAPLVGSPQVKVTNVATASKPPAPIGASAVPSPKPALLPTPTIKPTSGMAPTQPAATINVTQKLTTKTSTPPQNIQTQSLNLSSTPTVSATPGLFDMKNAFGTAMADKTNNDKENAPVGAMPVSKTQGTSSGFSFSSMATAAKPSTPVLSNIQAAAPVASSVAAPISSSISSSISSPFSTPTSTTKPPDSSEFSFTKACGEASIFGGSAAPKNNLATTGSGTAAAVSSSTDSASIFGQKICSPNVAENANAGKNLFSSPVFGNVTSPASAASVFGSSAANVVKSTSAQNTLFGGNSSSTIASTLPTTTTTASPFGVKTAEASNQQQTPESNIFGSKTADSTSTLFSSFGLSSTPASSATSPSATTGNIFASAAAAKPAQNIFGGGSANNATSTASIFGGASPASPTNAFGSSNAFGNANQSTNLFGGSAATPTSTNATSPQSGSIFGGGSVATNSVSGGSIFGGSSGFGSPQQQQQQQQQPQTGSIFGSSGFGNSGGAGGGGFGQQSPNATSTSTFGGSFSQATSNAPSFGSPAFASPFGQAQTAPGFGSPQPQQQQQNPGFGLGAIQASSNPTFGSNATFGSAPTFGSPKSGFGSFANMNPAPSFTSPQKNSLFESLGSSDNAMTFGNLAQSQNPPPKQFSGGSSFSSWR